MTDAEFKKALKFSILKMNIIGVLITSLGLFSFWMLTTDDPEALKNTNLAGEIVLWLITIFTLALGPCVIYLNIKHAFEIKREKHPLLNAITNQDQHYVLWFYLSRIAIKNGEIYQVVIYSNDKRRLPIQPGSSKYKHILSYLRKKFPNAMEGNTKENAERYKNFKKQM